MSHVKYHAQITAQANHGLLNPEQLQAVVLFNLSVDLDQLNSCLHFDNCTFECGVAEITHGWSLIAGQGDWFDLPALCAFGRLLHTTQDFYAHSNWVELHQAERPVPVWDQQVVSLPDGIVSGTFLLDWPKLCEAGTPSHAELNKDSPDSTEGKKIVDSGVNKGKTLFDLAFETAVAASVVQFERLGKGQPLAEPRRARPGLPVAENGPGLAEFIAAASDRAVLTRPAKHGG